MIIEVQGVRYRTEKLSKRGMTSSDRDWLFIGIRLGIALTALSTVLVMVLL